MSVGDTGLGEIEQHELQQQSNKLEDLSGRISALQEGSEALWKSLGQPRPSQGNSSAFPAPDKQTIVLPIGPKDFERFENLYKSLVKFFDFDGVEEWILVMPDRSSEIGRQIVELTQPHHHLIRIIEDTECVPKLKDLPTTNWMTQQILKLGIASFVRTRFYLVLDSDLLCYKPTSFTDLIVNGKAITNMYDSPHTVHHKAWWDSSERVLDMKYSAPTYFGVTPCILATDVVVAVHRRLEEVHSKEWSQYLLENVFSYTFTEYCIYAVFAVHTNQFADNHYPMINGVYNSERSMWWVNEFDNIHLPEMVNNAHYYPGHFLVMQSNTKIDASEVRVKMGSLFD